MRPEPRLGVRGAAVIGPNPAEQTLSGYALAARCHSYLITSGAVAVLPPPQLSFTLPFPTGVPVPTTQVQDTLPMSSTSLVVMPTADSEVPVGVKTERAQDIFGGAVAMRVTLVPLIVGEVSETMRNSFAGVGVRVSVTRLETVAVG
jgi:hypothetical protein